MKKKLLVMLALCMMLGGCGINKTKNEDIASEKTKNEDIAPEKTEEVKTMEETKYEQAVDLYESGDYENARILFEELGTYNDSTLIKNKCLVELAKAGMNNEDYKKAIELLTNVPGDEAANLLNQCNEKLKAASEVLAVEYVVNQSDEEMANQYYKNGAGTLKFESIEPLDDWVGFGGKYVTYCVPMSSIHFRLTNEGNEKLQNVVMKLEFDEVYLQAGSDNFVMENHINGIGGYAGASLNMSEGLQAGVTKDFMFSLSEAYFTNGSTATMKITVSADNYPARTYAVPLSLLVY